MTRPIRVLHLEDSPRDAELLHEHLRAGGVSADVVLVTSKERFEAALASDTFDLILSDYNIPGYDGMIAVKLAREQRPETPVIVVSGTVDEEEAVKCLHLGATDYLLKQRLDRLAPAVKRAVQEADERRSRHKAEANLLESEERLRQLAEQSSEGFWFVALNPQRILYVSPAVEAIWGLSAERLYQNFRLWMGAVHKDDRARIQKAWDTWEQGEASRFDEEFRIVQPDGSLRWVLTRGTKIRDQAGVMIRLSGLTQDVTERKKLEAQFRQAQKMESVGQLAGGIAHDFNNLLTVINGTAEVALAALREDDPLYADLQEIRRAGERAAALTRQLLAFSRKQILQLQVMDLNLVVAEMESLLKRLIGEDIDVVVAPTQGVSFVKADPGQFEQVLANLAVNARDAMPQGGQLTIEVQNVEIDDAYARQHGVAAVSGPYVMLAISDTGVGMDEATRRQIFEPFFTTKDLGKGTGLGLSTVYGIVKQSDGFIWVYSEVGHGTSFKIYLPRVAEGASLASRGPAGALVHGTETILLVEDEPGLRNLVKRMLEAAGYTVLAAGGGEEALQLLQQYDKPLHLMVTDVVMPRMSGRTLAERLHATRPGMKVLYVSGYTDDVVVRHRVLDDGMPFLGKPFTSVQLTRKVREVLDSTP